MNAAAQPPQSDDATLMASVDELGGCCWELCSAAGCLRDRSRLELLRRWSAAHSGEQPGPA